MPQLPIPDDWNGEDWLCLQVQWPNSVKYRALLAGFLSYLGRGRAYDRDTGSIKDAQEIGWEIFYRNTPFVPCVEQEEPTEQPSPGEYPCDWAYENVEPYESEDEMACYIDALECREGVLWYRMCGKWYPVEGCTEGQTPPSETDEDVIPSETPEQAESWKCSKATVIVNKLFEVAEAALDNALTLDFIGNVQDAVGMDLNNAALRSLHIQIAIMTVLQLEEIRDDWTLERKADMICDLSKRLDGSNNDIGPNQWDIIKNEVTTSFAPDIFMQNFASLCLLSIGFDNLRTLTRTAVYLLPSDCCPSESEIPGLYDWAHEIDFSAENTLYDWVPTGVGATHEIGTGIVSTPVAYGDRLAGVVKSLPPVLPEGARFTFMLAEFTSWPVGDGATTFWFKLGPDVIYSDNGLYGKPLVKAETDRLVSQGQPIEFCWNSTLENPPSGEHILKRIVYAGLGTDPFPADPAYTP